MWIGFFVDLENCLGDVLATNEQSFALVGRF